MIKAIINLCFLVSLSFISFSQIETHSFNLAEKNLQHKFERISKLKIDSIKSEINDSILSILDTLLLTVESYNHPFNKLEFVGKILSPDKSFRIINWNLNYKNGTYKYYGYIQYYDKKNNSIRLFPLIDNSENITNPKHEILNNENWYGALYYKIIQNNYGKDKYYTILGWDGNDDFTTKKIIEFLYFTKSGKPKFGKNVFKIEDEKMKRVIFEYSNRALLTLRYDEHLKMIVYEHLSPEKPSQIGHYKFYIPDFSYDALEFKNGKYIHHTAIDAYDRKKKSRKEINEIRKQRIKDSF